MTMPGRNGEYSPQGLDGLFTASPNAQRYYDSLPEYVREMIAQRKDNIKSEDELRRYAENIVQGDK